MKDIEILPMDSEPMSARSIELLVLTIMSSLGVLKVVLKTDELQKHHINNDHVKATNLDNGNLLYEIEEGEFDG